MRTKIFQFWLISSCLLFISVCQTSSATEICRIHNSSPGFGAAVKVVEHVTGDGTRDLAVCSDNHLFLYRWAKPRPGAHYPESVCEEVARFHIQSTGASSCVSISSVPIDGMLRQALLVGDPSFVGKGVVRVFEFDRAQRSLVNTTAIMSPHAQEGEEFGYSLAAFPSSVIGGSTGTFLVGAPGRVTPSGIRSGAVFVYRSTRAATGAASYSLDQEFHPAAQGPSDGDRFGHSLAVQSFPPDRTQHLYRSGKIVVGMPEHSFSGKSKAGMVQSFNVFNNGQVIYHQRTFGARAFDFFGTSVGVSKQQSSRLDYDFVVGAPGAKELADQIPRGAAFLIDGADGRTIIDRYDGRLSDRQARSGYTVELVSDGNIDGYPEMLIGMRPEFPSALTSNPYAYAFGSGGAGANGAFGFQVASNDSRIAVTAGDLTGDGVPELVASSPGSQEVVVRSMGGSMSHGSPSGLNFSMQEDSTAIQLRIGNATPHQAVDVHISLRPASQRLASGGDVCIDTDAPHYLGNFSIPSDASGMATLSLPPLFASPGSLVDLEVDLQASQYPYQGTTNLALSNCQRIFARRTAR